VQSLKAKTLHATTLKHIFLKKLKPPCPITTLFNLFCPFIRLTNLELSIFTMVIIRCIISIILILGAFLLIYKSIYIALSKLLFPSIGIYSRFFLSSFLGLALLNLISLVAYRYPVTTTLAFNLSAALSLWLASILLFIVKLSYISSLLPVNSPWYLVPFLSLVELIRLTVRPITLCFRLLANISAGHIILSLICKLPIGSWVLGVSFGLLELIVALVQAFVFLILVSVYMEETISH